MIWHSCIGTLLPGGTALQEVCDLSSAQLWSVASGLQLKGMRQGTHDGAHAHAWRWRQHLSDPCLTQLWSVLCSLHTRAMRQGTVNGVHAHAWCWRQQLCDLCSAQLWSVAAGLLLKAPTMVVLHTPGVASIGAVQLSPPFLAGMGSERCRWAGRCGATASAL